MNFIKRTLEISKVYRPPSGSRKDEYDISFQEFFENIKKNIPFLSKLPSGNSSIILLIIIVISSETFEIT